MTTILISTLSKDVYCLDWDGTQRNRSKFPRLYRINLPEKQIGKMYWCTADRVSWISKGAFVSIAESNRCLEQIAIQLNVSELVTRFVYFIVEKSSEN